MDKFVISIDEQSNNNELICNVPDGLLDCVKTCISEKNKTLFNTINKIIEKHEEDKKKIY